MCLLNTNTNFRLASVFKEGEQKSGGGNDHILDEKVALDCPKTEINDRIVPVVVTETCGGAAYPVHAPQDDTVQGLTPTRGRRRVAPPNLVSPDGAGQWANANDAAIAPRIAEHVINVRNDLVIIDEVGVLDQRTTAMIRRPITI